MNNIKIKSKELVNKLIEKKLKITSAESCTGGLFASSITSISGSSACFEGSFVTYSNEIKNKIINVKKVIRDFDFLLIKELIFSTQISDLRKK